MEYLLGYAFIDEGNAVNNIGIQRELFEKLFQSAPDPIVIVDDMGIIKLANSETGKKFGYSSEQLVDKPIEVLIPERFRGKHTHYREGYTSAPKVRPMGEGANLCALRQDGSEFPVEISLSPLKIADTLFVISIIRDITERKKILQKLEETNLELKRSNQELEQFAYVASHDLQEPLRSVAGSCQFLERKFQDHLDPLAQEFVGYAVDGAKRMQELINDLLSYSRVTTHAKELLPTECDKILEQALFALKSSIAESQAKILCDPLPVVKADRVQLLQVFQNLIGNALKFRGIEPPEIHVSAVPDAEFWRFRVKDNGIGIDPKYFEKIFVIFRRLHQRELYPGTGIGLATCKKIIERHGGKIWVESQVGQGATFYFTIPRTS